MPAHFAGLPRNVSFAFIVIAVTRGFTDETATRASFTLATLRDLILPGMAASFSFQVRSSEVVWISMISLRGLHLFVLPARCHVHTCRARQDNAVAFRADQARRGARAAFKIDAEPSPDGDSYGSRWSRAKRETTGITMPY